MEEKKIIISSEEDRLGDYLRKIWQYRSLVWVFAKRDLKIKYAQTILGVAWTVLQPLTSVIVFTLFFSVVLNIKAEYPYILFVLSGIAIWGLFNYIFLQGSTSLTQNQDLIRKISFPKILLPLSKVVLGLVEFGVILVLLLVVMAIMRQDFRWSVLLLPVALLPVLFFSSGITMALSALTVKNRDLFHIVPFLVNFGIWFTPVFYPVSIIPSQYAKYQNMIFVNPMAANVQLFRWCLFGDSLNGFVIVGLLICFLTFIVGFYLFKKTEDKIIDWL